jgi:tetratricopeptide (TPR) repeat protein
MLSVGVVWAEVVTFEREYKYQASEADSKLYCRAIALEQVKVLLLEELGVYLESETEVKNFQLTKDQISTMTAGIVMTEILDEKWDGQTYTMKAMVKADSDEVVKSVDSLRKDRQGMRELQSTRAKAKAALMEVEKLKSEISSLKGDKKLDQMRKYDKAVKELSAVDWLERGIGLYKKKKLQEAVYAFTKTIELSPEFTIAYYNRGNIYARDLGNHQEAIMDYDRVLELSPEYVKAYNNRGMSYIKLGNFQLAVRDFDKAIELKPSYTTAYLNRGFAYSKLGKQEQAINDYDKVIELDPKFARAYSNRGVIYKRFGNIEKACSDWKSACKYGECDKLNEQNKKRHCR